MKLQAAGSSDVGQVRQANEDEFLVDHELALLVVADGMGGHAGGQTAARLATATLAAHLRACRDSTTSGEGATEMLIDAVKTASKAVFAAAQQDRSLRGMGTTLTAAWLSGSSPSVCIAHVGDSRCYLQRDADIVQVTDDHSWVNEQVKAGNLTLEEARSSRMRNIITRSVGFEASVLVDTFILDVHVGDTLILCSDGLVGHVEMTEMAAIVASSPVDVACTTLIDLANQRGGEDNITVVCARLVEDDEVQQQR